MTAYTASTTNGQNKVTATAEDAEATVSVTVNGTEIENGASPSWSVGENTVAVTVTLDGNETVYTVTVTKS